MLSPSSARAADLPSPCSSHFSSAHWAAAPVNELFAHMRCCSCSLFHRPRLPGNKWKTLCPSDTLSIFVNGNVAEIKEYVLRPSKWSSTGRKEWIFGPIVAHTCTPTGFYWSHLALTQEVWMLQVLTTFQVFSDICATSGPYVLLLLAHIWLAQL